MLWLLENPFTWLDQQTYNGLAHALGAIVFHWGVGVGVIILLLLAAYVSPINKQYFIAAAGVVVVILFVYGWGQKDQAALCKTEKVLVLKKQLAALHKQYVFTPRKKKLSWL